MPPRDQLVVEFIVDRNLSYLLFGVSWFLALNLSPPRVAVSFGRTKRIGCAKCTQYYAPIFVASIYAIMHLCNLSASHSHRMLSILLEVVRNVHKVRSQCSSIMLPVVSIATRKRFLVLITLNNAIAALVCVFSSNRMRMLTALNSNLSTIIETEFTTPYVRPCESRDCTSEGPSSQSSLHLSIP